MTFKTCALFMKDLNRMDNRYYLVYVPNITTKKNYIIQGGHFKWATFIIGAL